MKFITYFGKAISHNFVPTSIGRNKKHFSIVVRILDSFLNPFITASLYLPVHAQSFLLSFKLVGTVLQKEHAKNIVFVLRSIHFATEDISCFEEVALKLSKC